MTTYTKGPSDICSRPIEHGGSWARASHWPTISRDLASFRTWRYPGKRTLISELLLRARGNAADTAASPPTWTSSSNSDVTNKTFGQTDNAVLTKTYFPSFVATPAGGNERGS